MRGLGEGLGALGGTLGHASLMPVLALRRNPA